MKENSLYDKKSLRSVIGKTSNFSELAKDCVAFSNAQGGVIDIGIEDEMEFPSPDQRITEDVLNDIEKKIMDKCRGVMFSAIKNIAENGGEYISLKIQRNINSISMTHDSRIYIRIGDSSRPINSDDIPRLLADKNCYSWEDKLTEYHWKDADPEKLEVLLKQLRSSDRVSDFIKDKEVSEILDYYFLTDPKSGQMTNLGVLFIGKQTQRGRINNAPVIQCIKYDNYGEKVNKWLWDDFRLNPYELINDVWVTIPEWRESTEISDGLFRKNIPAYQEVVIRELLCNALVHRQYTIKGDIFINIHPDYLEIVNPGTLPLGVTVDNILHTTKKRNEHMASLFYALHLMEREGSGYDMMYEQLLSNGKNVPFVREMEDAVCVKVERLIVNREAIRLVDVVESEYGLKQKHKICLGLIAIHESITASALLKILSLKDANELRAWLQYLVEKNVVLTTKNRSKAKEYRVNPNILRQVNFKGKTTLKRIEPYRLKELILEDLKLYKHAKISDINSRIGSEIASRKIWEQLKELEREGKIEIIGSNRWTEYKLK